MPGCVVLAKWIEVMRGQDEGGGLRVDEEVVPLDGGSHQGAGENLALFAGHGVRLLLCGR